MPITTVLGTGEAGFSGDGGPANKAKIRGPFGVTIGPDVFMFAMFIITVFEKSTKRG